MTEEDWQPPIVLLTVDLVILTLRGGVLHVLLVERGVRITRSTVRSTIGGCQSSSVTSR